MLRCNFEYLAAFCKIRDNANFYRFLAYSDGMSKKKKGLGRANIV